ncbi:hypothetical protein GCM10007989_04810 [Devosia pacifica]|uniref:Signal recognition particle n=1 Tax=Devosia pacifica TaxID=1335967 RepID=A0A918RY08_9HYPH|nr:signal recognition particle [Devosia pacifica]GHA13266.1 hypothetical protein GCM10007989_04810 [Devosia pacifica]
MRAIITGLLMAVALPAVGQDFGSMNTAVELGTVLGSEEACGLSYDQEAITAFIEAEVAADDMSFASTLQTMVMGQEMQINELSASAKTAHCAQITRVARSYGFIE